MGVTAKHRSRTRRKSRRLLSHIYYGKASAKSLEVDVADRVTPGAGLRQRSKKEELSRVALWLKAPDVGRCVSINCKCIVSPTAVRLLPGEGAKGLT